MTDVGLKVDVYAACELAAPVGVDDDSETTEAF
jgi:hypothetical protein